MKERLKHLLTAGDRLELSLSGPGGIEMTLETSLRDLDGTDRIIVQAPAPESPRRAAARGPDPPDGQQGERRHSGDGWAHPPVRRHREHSGTGGGAV